MVIEIILWFIFIGSAVLLSVVILLQEAKSGGLAEAFGGLGAQTFGVKSTGVNKFTSYTAAVFLASAVLITLMRSGASVAHFTEPAPAEPPAQSAPSEPGTQAPAPAPQAPQGGTNSGSQGN